MHGRILECDRGNVDAALISHHPKPMPQLAQGRELGEAEKPEGIAMLRLAFQRADHERAGETPVRLLRSPLKRGSPDATTMADDDLG